jgi:hypothetical protein
VRRGSLPLGILASTVLGERFAGQDERLSRCIDINRFVCAVAMPARSEALADCILTVAVTAATVAV